MTRQRGFTLVELLVAIFILAIVAVLGWRGLDGIIRSRAVLTDQMAQTRGLQLTFAQMQSDCENLAPTTLLNSRANLSAEDGRLTLVRLVFMENEASRLEVVSYRLADGVLTRRESAPTRDLLQLDTLWQAAVGDTAPSAAVALQSGVNGMTSRLWVGNTGWRAAAGVNSATGAAQAAQAVIVPLVTNAASNLPTALEVSLTLRGQEIPMIKSFLLGAL